MNSLLLAILLVPLQEEPAPAPSGTERVLEVRFLANEGFLLTAGDDVVAIDAFVTEPYSVYGSLDGSVEEALLEGTGPFASLDLALTSHVHRDHFQPEPARALLEALPDCVFASSPQVIRALLDGDAPPPPTAERSGPRAVLPERGEEERLEVEGVRVDVLRLTHGTGRFAGIQNLGHVVTLGGVTVLHVGDAAMAPGSFAPYRLRERGIDVAFVPYWYFLDPAGRALVEQHFRPARLVACHVPPGELETVVEQLGRSFPDVKVPREPLELFRFGNER